MAVGAVVARILTQYSDKGSKQAQKDIAKLGKRIDAFGKKANKAFLAAGAATAVFAVKIGTDAVKAAIEDSKSQAILANNLRNVTGATDATIKSVEEYISKQQMLANVSDTELRASFSQLVLATGDVTTAMDLQSVALDTAAGSGKDLGSVSAAIAKATQGNFTALKKLVPTLDANIVKNKDLGAALVFLDKTYKGSAKTLGDTDPIKKLSLAYGEVLETLGYALLPVVIEFAEYIRTDIIPSIEEWVALNEGRLQDSFRTTLNTIVGLTKSMITLLQMIEDWKYLLLALGSIPYLAGLSTNLATIAGFGRLIDKVLIGPMLKWLKFGIAYLPKFATAIRLLSTAFVTLGARAAIAAIPVALATAGVSVGAAVTALALVGVTAFVVSKNMKDATDSTEGATAAAVDLTKQVYGGAAAEKYKAEVAAKAAKDKLERDKRLALITARQAANDKKTAAIEAKNLALKASLEKKYNVKITDPAEYENIQLNAVEKLQAKQKDADATLAKRIQMRKDELALFQALNTNAQRYTDLLVALADNKLSDTEIELLAKKWGLTVDAAKSYIFTVFAIKDEQVSPDEVDKLAEAWGITKAQAAQYLEFFAALNDGKLSDLEIAKLMAKWGLTKEEALKYADFISKIGDGKLDDKEIENLKSKWGLTTQQVVDYIVKIGGKVDASGSSILSAGDIAAIGWTNALNALNAYLAALGKGTGGVPVVVPPVVIVPKAGDPSTSNGNAIKALEAATASKAAADAYAAAKAKGDMDAAAKAAAGVTPSALAAGESGAIGAASIASQLRAAEAARAAADAAAKQASSLAAFKAKEAADLAASQAAAASMDYDEKFRMRSAQGVMSASSGFKGLTAGGNTNVTVNVAGSVTSENDLVATVRNGLLRGQINGQTLTLEAI
jgi:hypothetical protein